ncbi:ornithine cyclodeaminase family protein [Streptomyces sp. NPDC050560]|uniref:ornithine cyclodeaminase family protein n=1 Tax=Streptomyces sp. NPDC050560 TaxID=3365630 RepID=UPI0037AEB1DC
MTLHLDAATIAELCTEDVALRAARAALHAQRSGDCVLPPRIDVDVPTGFLRVMPAALGDHMGTKVMTLARGVGNRYLLLVYRQATGDLVATLDAAEVTRLRTAATTAVAGELLRPAGTDVLGLVGTGFEADGHLRAFAKLWPLSKVLVHSRSAEKRQSFADRLGTELGFSVRPAATVEEVVASCPVTVLCTKSTEPVVHGADFTTGAAVLSIGSTRPDLRELDVDTFARARRVLVDDPAQVLAESGDVAEAVQDGALAKRDLVAMPQWTEPPDPADGRDLLVFKSVGTALQDLALATTLIEGARARGLGREIGDITELKAIGMPPRRTQ